LVRREIAKRGNKPGEPVKRVLGSAIGYIVGIIRNDTRVVDRGKLPRS